MEEQEKLHEILIRERDGEVRLPVIKYRLVADVGSRRIYKGPTLPIPLSLLEYLNESELKVFSFILDRMRKTGHCVSMTETMANALGVTRATIQVALTALKNMGFVYYEPLHLKRDKLIDFDVVARLDDIVRDLKVGASAELKKRAGRINVNEIPQNMIDELRKDYKTDISDYADEFETDAIKDFI